MVDAARQVPKAFVEDRVLLVRHAFEQVPVVTDHEQGAGEGVQQIFDGREHVGVEVVGGLIQNQHVGFAQQDEQ